MSHAGYSCGYTDWFSYSRKMTFEEIHKHRENYVISPCRNVSNICLTRMHSSRMLTIHCSGRLREGGLPWGSVWPGGVHHPPDRILDTRLWKHYHKWVKFLSNKNVEPENICWYCLFRQKLLKFLQGKLCTVFTMYMDFLKIQQVIGKDN